MLIKENSQPATIFVGTTSNFTPAIDRQQILVEICSFPKNISIIVRFFIRKKRFKHKLPVMKRMKLLFTLAIPVVLFQSAQAQSSRLISQGNWYNNGTIFKSSDSTAYDYTNPRGGDLTHTLAFDRATNWLTPDSGLINNGLTTQEFYSDNKIKSTTVQTWDAFSMDWKNSTKVNYWYNADGTIDYTIYQTWGGSAWTNVSKNAYSYGSGKLVRNEYQLWNGVTFVASTAKIYSYDAYNNVAQILSQAYESGIWVYTNIYEYTYTGSANNWLSSTKYSIWNGSSFTNNRLTSNTYDTTGNMLTTVYQNWNATTSGWDNANLSVFSNFTSSHMAQTEITQSWDTASGGTWKNNKQYTYSFNSFGQLTEKIGISWNVAGFWEYEFGDIMNLYHYEAFTAGVKNTVAENGTLTVFPNPANNFVSLNLNWNEAQAFTVSVFNANGALVSVNNVEATAKYVATIPVDGMATGNYFVKVAGAKGQIVRQFSVIR
ncbi:MAG: T9SS C-terminal target domain-containing protein [Chitinophagia bacterium]|nr:T9SS C-terminal target domain-containing protein [Chitinophagia bacterium]